MKTDALPHLEPARSRPLACAALRSTAICALLLTPLAVVVTNMPHANAADRHTDTGWTSLYNGTLDDFRIYFRGQGYIDDVHKQDVYVAKPDHIHVTQGTNGVIVTKAPYSHYHVKVDYRWGKKGGSKNAGLMTHVNLESDRVKDNRPRSVEINMKADSPGSIWLASGLGPFADTFIEEGTRRYLPKEQGGVEHHATPFGDRTIRARYPDNKMNTNDYGEWNTLEAIVRGSESVEIILNGETVNVITDLRKPKPGTKEPGEPLSEGGIGLQSEGQEIFYRNFKIKKLEPLGKRTNVPRMYFADNVSGRPFSKDPAVVKFKGKYWLYYSVPPYKGKPTVGWSIGVATSQNLVDWTKAGYLRNTGEPEAKGFAAPGAIVLRDKVHLFYQTYGNGERDAICHAWSEDGLNFKRNPTNPIFRPTGEWTVGRAIDADVIPHGDRLLMYWSTRDPSMKIQMQGVAAAPLDSDFSRGTWTQLNRHGPILAPTVPTDLDAPGLNLAWEKRCIEAAAMGRRHGRLYMFYAGGYNNDPQQIGVAVSDDGVRFKRLSDKPIIPNGAPGSWNSSESGHPYLFQDEDGQDYLFYQGNDTNGKTWYLSVVPIDWKAGEPVPAPEKLPDR